MPLSGNPMVTGVALNGKKCWQENVLSTKPAPGCRMKRWKPSALIRWHQRSFDNSRRWRYPFLERSLASDARFVCLPRPVRWYKGIVSPLKEPQKVDMCVFRENTEDIYAGIEWEAGTPEAEKFYRFLRDDMGVTKVRFPETSSFGVKPVSREGTERLVRAACQYALEHHLPSVTLVHKGNIMKFTEGGFKKWGYELAEREFGKELAEGRLVIKDCIADAFLQNTLLIPEEYSVIATLNLNGDYVSDQLAAW